MGRVVALEIAGEDRDIGLAEDDRASGAQSRDGRRILVRNALAIGGQPARGGQAGDVEGVLDRDRQPFEGAGAAIGDAFVRCLRRDARRFAVLRDDGIQARVQRVDALERSFQKLGGTEAAGEKRRAQRGGRGRQVDGFGHGDLTRAPVRHRRRERDRATAPRAGRAPTGRWARACPASSRRSRAGWRCRLRRAGAPRR